MILEVNTIPQNLTPVENYPLLKSFGEIIDAETAINRLLDEIPFSYTIFIIGGFVNRGYTNSDIDIWIEQKISKKEKIDLEFFFTNMLNYRVHIINADINEEKWSPVYMYKIYEQNKKIIYS